MRSFPRCGEPDVAVVFLGQAAQGDECLLEDHRADDDLGDGVARSAGGVDAGQLEFGHGEGRICVCGERFAPAVVAESPKREQRAGQHIERRCFGIDTPAATLEEVRDHLFARGSTFIGCGNRLGTEGVVRRCEHLGEGPAGVIDRRHDFAQPRDRNVPHLAKDSDESQPLDVVGPVVGLVGGSCGAGPK